MGQGFEKARNFVAAHKDRLEVFSCCCAHPHTDDCKWMERFKEVGAVKAHELHMPKCQCKFSGNLHAYSPRRTCSFAYEFVERFGNWDPIEVFPEDAGDCMYMCCCMPTLPHDESMKFLMLEGAPRARERTPFRNLRQGELEVRENVPEQN